MRHSYFGKKLSRTSNERQSLFRNQMRSMVIHGAIKTTKTKAIAVRSDVERLITKAKKGTDAMRRDVLATLADRKLTDQLMEMAKTQFSSRDSGYTRIVKLGTRRGDATETVLLSFVDERVVAEVVVPATKGKATITKASTVEEKVEPKKRVVKKKTA